jgi:hypothetical protein
MPTAWAQQGEAESTTPVSFDIAAQPLASALDRYSEVTGIQIVYDGALAWGRHARPVKGDIAPESALRQLLDGTGLVAIYAAPNAFTLKSGPSALASRNHEARTISDYMPYLAIVQSAVRDEFCRHPLTTPGTYSIKLKFWIGSGGQVLHPQLVDVVDTGAREQAMIGTLQRLRFDRSPPADMPQPVIMAIARRSPQETGDCGAWNDGLNAQSGRSLAQ